MKSYIRNRLFLFAGFYNYIRKDILYRKCYLTFKERFDTKIFPANTFPINCISAVGKHSYGPISVLSYDGSQKLNIGNYMSVASECLFILGGNHDTSRISTYPFHMDFPGFAMENSLSKGDIVIKDDVWIGTRSIILSGVTVGQGAVIAAGSVVTKNVQPYSIVGGNPARRLKYRYDEELREKCLQVIDYSQITDDFINMNSKLFLQPVTMDLVCEIDKRMK